MNLHYRSPHQTPNDHISSQAWEGSRDVTNQVLDNHAKKLRQLALDAANAKKERDKNYFTTRTVKEDRDFLIACRHWNSSTPVIPRQSSDLLPLSRLSGYGYGGGYFLVLKGVGIVVDPGYGFMQLLYNSYGYTICDVDAVFVTHDHPDHWADLANILVLKHMASRYPGNRSTEPKFYLNRTVSELRHFLFPTGYPCHTIGRSQVVTIERDGQEVVKVTGMRAFHSERLSPDMNSPHAIGLHFEVTKSEDRPGLRTIAIAGDTQCPSQKELDRGKHNTNEVDRDDASADQSLSEFTPEDVQEFRQEYDAGEPGVDRIGEGPRGRRAIDVLAVHIGSVEPKMSETPDLDALGFIKKNVRYDGYHLGFAGCLRMLDMTFRNDLANKFALLTEFGEELYGYRADLAMALESATEANSQGRGNVRVLPADIGMALQLTWSKDSPIKEPLLRCTKCLRMKELDNSRHSEALPFMDPALFHPVSEMQIIEDLDTGLIQYCCHW